MNNIIKYLSISVTALLSMTGCTERFEMLNTNPNQVTGSQMEAKNYRVGTKVLALQSLVIPVQEHMYQFNESLTGGPFGGYIGSTVDTWLQRFETFNPSDDWRKWPFANVITDTYTPYRGIINGSGDEVAAAFANLLRVAIMMRVTDTYGPIPYSDAVNNESIFVKYDSQEAVYKKMFEEIDSAIKSLSENKSLPASAWKNYDKVYFGDIAKWCRYANSLKLRMAMRISYAAPELARTKAAEAIAAGPILSNEDNAYMHAVENRSTLIYNDWCDHRAGADIISYMTGYEDPRMEKMFLKNIREQYAGIRIGSTVTKKSEAIGMYSNMIVNSDTPYLWLNAAETSFLMAEYELRFGNKEKAKDLYNNGILLSFAEKGANGAEAYISDNTKTPALYLDPLDGYSATQKMSECRIAWEDAGDEETNLEKIIVQKWIAIFPLGTEAWSEYRRTGYPKLLPAPQNLGPDQVDLEHHARRLDYPVEEYRSNSDNLNAAISTLNSESIAGGVNGDSMGTRVWWDKKPYSQIKQ